MPRALAVHPAPGLDGAGASVGLRLGSFSIDAAVVVLLAAVAVTLTRSMALTSIVIVETVVAGVVWEARTGLTVGHAVLHLRTVRDDRPWSPGAVRAMARAAVVGAGALLGAIGAWVVVASAGLDRTGRGRTWADRVGRTVVVRVADVAQPAAEAYEAPRVPALRPGLVSPGTAVAGPVLPGVPAPGAPGPVVPVAASARPAPPRPRVPGPVVPGPVPGLSAGPSPAAPRPRRLMVGPSTAAPAGPSAVAPRPVPPGPPVPPPDFRRQSLPDSAAVSGRSGGHVPPMLPGAGVSPPTRAVPPAALWPAGPSPVAGPSPAQWPAGPSPVAGPPPVPRPAGPLPTAGPAFVPRPAEPLPAAAPASIPPLLQPDVTVLLVLDTGQRDHLPFGSAAVLGRDPAPLVPSDRTVVVHDDAGTVSKSHLRVEHTPDGVWLTDLGSTNGTRLLGDDAAPVPLAPRTRTRIDGVVRAAMGQRVLLVSYVVQGGRP